MQLRSHVASEKTCGHTCPKPRYAVAENNGTLAGMRYEQYTAVLTAAFKQLKADNDNLVRRIEQLERKLAR